MPRSYNKTSTWWETRKKEAELRASAITPTKFQPISAPDLKYEFAGENLVAACAGSGSVTNTRNKFTNSGYFNGGGINGFENLSNYPLPYEISNGRISMGNTIQLVMRAYSGFPVFRNAIEVLVEFTNTPMHLKGGNAKSREFIQAWFQKVGMQKLSEQFFREYYRSGNVFLYRFDGRMRDADFKQMQQVFGAKSNIIPIRYVLINPTNVFVENAIITNNYTYVKLLSPFEVQRLKHPQTPEEREMFESLPDNVKQQIKNASGGGLKQIYVPIDLNRLYYVFYKKQDYEPLATPMGFGVLNDIEYKLQMKRIDMALTKTIEHAFLKITMGNEPDKHGINQANMQSMQDIFKNSTIGRVLVADYTTKAEWVIPDLKNLLGPEKYQVVNDDIREGLQSILLGDDKFANAVIKARVFNERLKEGRMVFKRDFLEPEIRRICAEMNFKSAPTVEFEEILLEDDTNLQRLYTRWAELGILAPWELIRAKQTGLLPEKADNIESQKEYKDLREDEFYYPLVGASAPKDGEALAAPSGRPSGTKSKQTTKKVSPIGGGVSSKKLMKAISLSNDLLGSVQSEFRKRFNLKKLDSAQQDLTASLAKAIMVNEDIEKWQECVASYMDSPKDMNKEQCAIVDEIRIAHEVDEWQAILLNKCKI